MDSSMQDNAITPQTEAGQRFVRISEDVIVDTETGDQLMPARETARRQSGDVD